MKEESTATEASGYELGLCPVFRGTFGAMGFQGWRAKVGRLLAKQSGSRFEGEVVPGPFRHHTDSVSVTQEVPAQEGGGWIRRVAIIHPGCRS